MGMTTINSRTFNQDASGAKRAAQDGPVFITDRGKPAHVLLTDPEAADIAFEPDRLDRLTRPADLS